MIECVERHETTRRNDWNQEYTDCCLQTVGLLCCTHVETLRSALASLLLKSMLRAQDTLHRTSAQTFISKLQILLG